MSRSKPITTVVGVAVAAAVLGLVSYTATKPDPRDSGTSVAAEPTTGVYPELESYARRDASDGLALGRADAPVVLIEYADFKCGYCAQFARGAEQFLIAMYVQKGVLRIEWRNFPIFGEQSEAAARASWAAGQQGRFWEFHKAAFAEGAKEKGFGPERLKALAKEAGVPDLAKFAADTESAAAREAVAADQEQGYTLGATSTPSFLVNGRPIAGAQPLDVFTKAIESAARTAKAKGTKAAGPSGAPSGTPSVAPSGVPSVAPSGVPSGVPSAAAR